MLSGFGFVVMGCGWGVGEIWIGLLWNVFVIDLLDIF